MNKDVKKRSMLKKSLKNSKVKTSLPLKLSPQRKESFSILASWLFAEKENFSIKQPTCNGSLDRLSVYSIFIFTLLCCFPLVAESAFSTPWTVALQAPLPMGFLRQEHWSGLPFPSPGDLLLHLQVDSLPLSHLGSPLYKKNDTETLPYPLFLFFPPLFIP